ncbi:MAG TPA: ECF-type sigma factor, partial [Thermoanaerobaculia bacterium]|nr:ECF-type sigma factor [Thermoanaerobaculia bacterium]
RREGELIVYRQDLEALAGAAVEVVPAPVEGEVELGGGDILETSMKDEVTRGIGAGPDGEAALWPVVYGELKSLARAVLRGRRRPAGPQTTTLVHEAYLRLVGSDSDDWNDRRHFYAVAARAMRFVLVDDARRRLSAKRGSGRAGVTLGDDLEERLGDPLQHRAEEVLAVHQALDRLGEVNPRHVRLIELRYFSGFTVDETAEALGVSRPTIVRDWRAVRVWLHGVLGEGGGAEPGGVEA